MTGSDTLDANILVSPTADGGDELDFSRPLAALRMHGASLSDRQWAALEGDIASALRKRFNLYADRARYPVIAKQKIERPIFVTGLPRAGTTLLHGVLAADPRARSPLLWECGNPSPPPGLDGAADAQRIVRAQDETDALPQEFLARHRKGPFMPEECATVIEPLTLLSSMPWARYGLDRWMHWIIDEADKKPAFRLHRHYLQNLQAFSPREWWVLKAPTHLFSLDPLLTEYPDARVVFIHRDPAEIVPSCASLVHYLWHMSGLAIDKRDVGERVISIWKKAMDRAMAFRHQHANPNQFFDIQNGDIAVNRIGAIESIYEHFGMHLTEEARSSMHYFMSGNGRGKHGKHNYTAEEFGLSSKSIRGRFGEYIETYRPMLNA